jgi:hypothetical protein
MKRRAYRALPLKYDIMRLPPEVQQLRRLAEKFIHAYNASRRLRGHVIKHGMKPPHRPKRKLKMHGLGHCPDPLCVMSFSNTIRDVDRKSARLCPRCKFRLALLTGGRR